MISILDEIEQIIEATINEDQPKRERTVKYRDGSQKTKTFTYSNPITIKYDRRGVPFKLEQGEKLYIAKSGRGTVYNPSTQRIECDLDGKCKAVSKSGGDT